MSEFSDSSSDSSYNSHGDAASESSTVYTPGNSEANYGAFNDLELGSMDLLRQETRVIKDCLNWTIRFLLSLILFFVLAAVLMWARIELDSRALAGVWIFVIVVSSISFDKTDSDEDPGVGRSPACHLLGWTEEAEELGGLPYWRTGDGPPHPVMLLYDSQHCDHDAQLRPYISHQSVSNVS